MKKIVLVFMVLITITMLSGCESTNNKDKYDFETEEEVMEVFVEAIENSAAKTLQQLFRLPDKNHVTAGFGFVDIKNVELERTETPEEYEGRAGFYTMTMYVTKKENAQIDFLEEGSNTLYVVAFKDSDGIWYMKRMSTVPHNELL